MVNFWHTNLDYMFFIFGTAFLLLAVISFMIRRTSSDSMLWTMLGLFGLVHGINELMGMLTFGLNDSPNFKLVRLIALTLSFLPLIEFARLGFKKEGIRVPGYWIYALILSALGLGSLAGMDGVNVVCRYAICLPAGILSGLLLIQRSRVDKTSPRWSLLLAGISLIIYGIVVELIISQFNVSPSNLLNNTKFLMMTGFTIQLVRVVCAICVTVGIWASAYWKTNYDEELFWLNKWFIPCVIILLLAAGWKVTIWRGKVVDNNCRSRLNSQAMELAYSINIERINALSFTTEAEKSIQHKRLCNQLFIYSRLNNQRGIRSYILRNGKFIFGPESYKNKDPFATTPGRVYQQPPRELFECYKEKRALVAGPYMDEYGRSVSGYAPIIDQRNGKVIMIVGLDIAAEDWVSQIAKARILPMFFTLMLIIFFLAGISISLWRRRQKADIKWKYRHIETILTAIMGLMITMVVVYLVNDIENQSHKLALTKLEEVETSRVSNMLRNIGNEQLESSTRFIDHSNDFSRKEFKHFALPLLRTQIVDSIGWAPRITDINRKKFEKKVSIDVHNKFFIFQKNRSNENIIAPKCKEYYPILYIEPFNKIGKSMGFNLASEQIRWKAVKEAIKTRLATATDPVRRISNNKRSIVVYLPKMLNNACCKKGYINRHGVIYITINLKSLFGPSASLKEDNNQMVHMDLFQVDGYKKTLWLASSTSARDDLHITRAQLTKRFQADNAYTAPIFIFGKTYALVAHPGKAFLVANPHENSWIAGIAGLIVTTILSVFIGFLSNGRSYLEKQVHTRTMELYKSEQRILATLRSIGDGVICTDASGFVTSLNTVAETLTGWKSEEALGKSLLEIFHIVNARTRKQANNPVEAALKSKSIVELDAETIIISKNGTERRIADSCAPIRDTDGNIFGAVLVFRDVTEESRLNDELREQDLVQRSILDNLASGVIIIDSETRVVERINPAAARMLGCSPEDVENNICHNCICPIEEGWCPAADLGIVVSNKETSILMKDGSSLPVIKSIDRFRIRGREKLLESFIDITERKKAEDTMDFQAHHDALTSLPNRLQFNNSLEAIISDKRRANTQVGVMFIDLDRFKFVNDSLGHNIGDMLLIEVGKRLLACVREEDLLCRMGGDEFTVILQPVFEDADINIIAERILTDIGRTFIIDGNEIHIGASIGVSLYPKDGTDAESIVKKADTAMYKAKELGRNNCQIYSQQMEKELNELMQMESELRAALKNNEFEVYYQPRIDPLNSNIVGVEALIRWNHPDRGLLLPEEFLKYAEETGIISKLEDFTLETVSAQLKKWLFTDIGAITVALNLNDAQLHRPEHITALERTLTEYGIPVSSIALEVSGVSLLGASEVTINAIDKLREQGLSIVLNDFGTGPVTLATLNKISVDCVKIDSTLIAWTSTNDWTDIPVAASITSVAHNMGLQVTAMGVETAEHMEFASSIMCDSVQGFLICPPLPADKFEDFIRTSYHENRPAA